jgi:hypothetical protein
MMTHNNSNQLPKQADLVIIGAGVAGLYCAWRILDNNPSMTIVILDRLNRTGGRLDTDLIKIEDDAGTGTVVVREEEGGMRFNYSMKELMALFGKLNLCDDIVDFPMTGKNNRYCLRGRSFSDEEARQNPGIWSELYNLAPAEQNQSPVDILTTVYRRILAVNGVPEVPQKTTPNFWQTLRLKYTWNGVTLNKWLLGGILRDMGYSEECIKMMAHSMGFEGPFISLMNAGEAFQLMEDFPSNPKYFTFKKGFSTLPNTLVEEIKKKKGQIFLSTNVDSIVRNGTDYELQLTVAPEGQSSSPLVPRGRKAIITAPKVIMALPRKALETLFITSPVLNDQSHAQQLCQDLKTATNQRLLKINQYYEEPWWNNGLTGQPPISFGPSFTDLPVNAVYPFYPTGGIQTDSPAALTIYCDWDNTIFWQGLQSVPPLFTSPLQKKYSKTPQVIFAASEAVVKEASRQFKELFNTHWIPRPVMTSFRLWDGEGDFGYAVHQWALDADDKGVIQRLIEPVTNIYTCNEAFSDMQGWVNGSLRSADLVLQKFGIKPLVDTAKGCQAG